MITRLLTTLSIVLLLISCNNQQIKPDGRADQLPNIVFILADDMGYGDPACYNPDSKILTPNIDKLAENGMRFTNAHAPAAWCTPSRYGLITGKYPCRTNIGLAGKQCLIEENQINLASMLKEKGYYTACIGKWHLGFDSVNYNTRIDGGPTDRGFDYYFGIPVSLDIPPYYYIENDKCVQAPTDTIEASNTEGVSIVQGAFWRKGGIAPDFRHEDVLPELTNKAAELIYRHHQNDSTTPLFLYFPLPGPHTPWLPTEEFQDISYAGMYGDFAQMVDFAVGRVTATLDELNMSKNTLIFFSSDNGPVWFDEDIQNYDHNASYFLKGIKSDMWEGGHRMPFIVKWPEQTPEGSVSKELIGFTDVLATLAEITTSDISNYKLDSKSFLSLIQGEQPLSPIREELIIDNKAIITKDWKYIAGHGGDGFNRAYSLSKERFLDLPRNKAELYNISKDSTESENLYKTRPGIAERLAKKLDSIITFKP